MSCDQKNKDTKLSAHDKSLDSLEQAENTLFDELVGAFVIGEKVGAFVGDIVGPQKDLSSVSSRVVEPKLSHRR